MSYLIIFSMALVGIPRFAQTAPLELKEQSVIKFAQNAAVRALDYTQGDRQSLIDAQDDFTEDGWREFMKRMEGWLDSQGAPLGSSSFMPNGETIIKDQENGLTHLTVSGTLRQSQNKSATTYRVIVDVRVGGNPAKITHLEPLLQVKAGAAAQQ